MINSINHPKRRRKYFISHLFKQKITNTTRVPANALLRRFAKAFRFNDQTLTLLLFCRETWVLPVSDLESLKPYVMNSLVLQQGLCKEPKALLSVKDTKGNSKSVESSHRRYEKIHRKDRARMKLMQRGAGGNQ